MATLAKADQVVLNSVRAFNNRGLKAERHLRGGPCQVTGHVLFEFFMQYSGGSAATLAAQLDVGELQGARINGLGDKGRDSFCASTQLAVVVTENVPHTLVVVGSL